MGKFQPGHKLSKGRPPKSIEIKQLETLDRLTVQLEISAALKCSVGHIEAALKHHPGEMTVLRTAVMKIAQRAANLGDLDSINFLLDRTIGKPKEPPPHDPNGEYENEHDKVLDIIPVQKLRELVKLQPKKQEDEG